MYARPRWTWLMAALALAGCKDDTVAAAPSASAPQAQAAPSAASPAATPTATTARSSEIVTTPLPRGPVSTTGPAYLHLPGDCDVLGQLDIGAMLALGAVDKQLLPEMRKALADKPAEATAQGLHAFLEQTAIKPLDDLKTLAFCVRQPMSPRPAFVAVVGGKLASNAVAQALVATNSNQFQLKRIGGIDVATSGERQWLGQAPDGVIVAANDRAMFEAALRPGKSAEQNQLPITQMFAAIISGPTVAAAATQSKDNPFAPYLLKVQQLSVQTDLAKSHSEARLVMPDSAAAKAFGEVLKTAIGELDSSDAVQSPAALVQLLKGTQLSYEGTTVVLTLPHGDEALEQLAKSAAAAMARRADRKLPAGQNKPSPNMPPSPALGPKAPKSRAPGF